MTEKEVASNVSGFRNLREWICVVIHLNTEVTVASLFLSLSSYIYIYSSIHLKPFLSLLSKYSRLGLLQILLFNIYLQQDLNVKIHLVNPAKFMIFSKSPREMGKRVARGSWWKGEGGEGMGRDVGLGK